MILVSVSLSCELTEELWISSCLRNEPLNYHNTNTILFSDVTEQLVFYQHLIYDVCLISD
jgi:hypothetical protein